MRPKRENSMAADGPFRGAGGRDSRRGDRPRVRRQVAADRGRGRDRRGRRPGHCRRNSGSSGPHRARAIALEPTTGVRRGDRARPAGGPITIAVGEGDARTSARCARPGRRPRAAAAPERAALAHSPQAATILGADGRDETVRDGIKVIDLLAPLAQGGKAAMFGGAASARRCW